MLKLLLLFERHLKYSVRPHAEALESYIYNIEGRKNYIFEDIYWLVNA